MTETSTVPRASIRKTLTDWLPVALWAALIFAFSAQPDLRFLPDRGLDFAVRKIGHATVFGILALLAWRALAPVSGGRRSISALVLAVAYAATDEWHQAFVAARHPSIADVGIDAGGALVALVLLGIYRARRP